MPHFSTSDVINCCLSCALALCACTWLNAANLFAQRPRTCQICPLTVVPSSTVNFLSTTCETLRARYQPTSLPAYQLAVSSHQSALPTYQLAISSYQVPLPTCCIQPPKRTANLLYPIINAHCQPCCFNVLRLRNLLPLRSLQVMEHLDTWALGELFLKEGISCHIVSIFEGSNRIRYAILYYY